MQPRQAAFRLLRRIALSDIKTAPKVSQPVWRNVQSHRNLHIRCSPRLQDAESSSSPPKPARFQVPQPPKAEEQSKAVKQPSYELTFTCKPCGERSTHQVSKQGYHFGSVLISCPGCKNRHVISDHLSVSLSQASLLHLLKWRVTIANPGCRSSERLQCRWKT